MQLQSGTLLQGGKYKIERVLGQGGFGITYLATQVGLHRRVAIKEFFMREYCNRDTDTSHVTIGSEGSRDVVEKFRSKFVKEAQNIACLKHPHIISIYDVFEENGTAYYVMEYLDRGSLAEFVKQRGRFSEADALRYIRQIADALRYIHARNMNHLDVKPGNILIDETDGAVLIDFGLSKRYDDEGNQTSTTPVGISHGYAPLEQYKKGGVGTFSPSTDIYSLGATLYKLITGDTPPDANDILTEGFPSCPAMMSDSVYNAIVQAMQLNKNVRPQSIEAFLALLDAKADEETLVVEANKQAKEERPALSPLQGGVPAGGRGLKGTSEKQHSEMERRGYEKKQTKKWLWPLLICLVAIVAFFGVRAYNNLNAENTRLAEEAKRVQLTGIINGHEWVDLGLNVKWATCNVGASSPSDYGNYYAWGETRTKSSYTVNNSTTYDLSEAELRSRGIFGSGGNLTSAYDAARANWGGTWRMPTLYEISKLKEKCSWVWTTMNGVKGYKVTGPNGNSIFLPAAGCLGSEFYNAGSYGCYWSATPYGDGCYDAYGLYFSSDDCSWNYYPRYFGLAVRPVSE